ncbi:DUF3226 domain-containing protein [Thiothrix sp.]|uniref:DUF3226 domain-containing protein n=1 Tax=Thiothrix sp. TaxID=1032 RepID=UPI002580BF11|nr:DUF3226 domain-containing protein [Thiothrix sp.]
MASKNVLVVESHNDKLFVEQLIIYINAVDIEVSQPICNIDEYECLSGLSELKLVDKLNDLRIASDKEATNKIGIMVDADANGIDAKLTLINSALKKSGFQTEVPSVNTWIYDDQQALSVSCHVLNVNAHGELETLLRTIKSQYSPFADCLDSWSKCLDDQGRLIKQKDFDKFWVSIYQRFDCCSTKERKQADRKCSPEASMKKPIWNFEHEALTELRAYLASFT